MWLCVCGVCLCVCVCISVRECFRHPDTHVVSLGPHAFDRGPSQGFQVVRFHGAELQEQLVAAARHVETAQEHGAAGVLPGAQHGGAHRPGPIHWAVALHWETPHRGKKVD